MVAVRSYMSVETAAEAAAEAAVQALVVADAERGRSRLAIPGGSALAAMRPLLAALPDPVRRRLRLTWTDERCVPLADPTSNRGAAARARLLPSDCAVTLPLWWEALSPAEAAARASVALQSEFASCVDVALLGLGEDGHIASLFPGHPALLVAGTVVHIADSPKPPRDRMTLTLALLRRAGLCVVLATGEGKRDALERIRRGDRTSPVCSLERAVIFTDLKLEDEA
jgi:6-phosphogluconolactonase